MNKDGLIRIQFLKNGQTKEIGLVFTFEQAIEVLKRQIEFRDKDKTMSFKPNESEVRKALGIISGRVRDFEERPGRLEPVTDLDRREAEDLIIAILKYGWNT